MAQLIPFAAAAVTFVYTGGNVAATQFAFVAASAAIGIFGPKPQGPGPGDLAAPQIDIGAQMPRIYGRVRLPLTPVWVSDFRATEIEQEGGKGAPEGPSSYTYSADILGLLADGNNALAWTRIFRNQKIEATRLASSSDESVEASEETDAWEEVELFDGNASQQPWAVYEDAEGASTVPAYRDVCTFAITDAQCGTTRQLPVFEVEVVTAASEGTINDPPLEELFTFDYGPYGSVQFGNSSFQTPITIFGETASSSPSGVTVYTFVDPNAAPTGESFNAIPGVGGGGVTPFGGTGDTTALIFRSGNSFYGYYSSLVEYTHTTANLLLVNVSSYAFAGNDLYICTDQSEIYKYDRSAGGNELFTNVSAEPCRTIVIFDGDVYGADPTGGDFIQWDGATLAEINRWSLALNSLGLICSDGEFVYDFTSTNQMVRFNGSTWDVVLSDVGDIATYLGPSGNQSAPVLSGGYVYLSRAASGTNWLLMRARYRLTTYEPQAVDLADIVTAELSLVPGLELSDYDVSDLIGIEVTGFKAIGPPAQSIADLADIYYFDLVPGAPMVFRRRSSTPNGSITVEETGAGVDNSGEPFAGIRVQNDDEIAPVVGLSFPNVNRAHEVDFTSGDRTVSEGPNVRRVQTNVVLTRAQARERAVAATLLARARGYSASFPLSDEYAAAEPGDVFTAEDVLGNTQNMRITRLTYADGVKQCEWELNDLTGIDDADLGVTETEEVITVAPIGTAQWLALDIPLLQDADDNAGYYAAVKVPNDETSATLYESNDDVTYSIVGGAAGDAVFGTVTAISGTLSAGGTFDETTAITVNVGLGTLSSATRDAVLSDRSVNAFVIGAHGRYVVGQFKTATLSDVGIYVLSGFLVGTKDTARYADEVAVSDNFCLLTDAGFLRVNRGVAQIGTELFVKAVRNGRAPSSINGQSFTNTALGAKPLSPLHLRIARDASNGDATITWIRQTRYQTRFGGDFGDAVPLGEDSKQYRVRVYTDGTYATVARNLGVLTTEEAEYTGAQQTSDFGSPQSTIYIGIAQLSGTFGAGYELQDSA